MTAEVGLMNRLGVALAADSAVSIGREANKIWTSADKLFHLSTSAPVGVMIYGNANFVGVPWESIVKEFRRDLGDRRFRQLREYADRFFTFLSRHRELFPTGQQEHVVSELVESLLLHLREQLERELTREAEERNGLDAREIAPIVEKVVADRLAVVRSHPRLDGFTPAVVSEIRRKAGPTVRNIRKQLFAELPMTASTAQKVASLALEMLSRRYLGPYQSGVVIAGFGEAESMPALYSFDVEEMVVNRPRRALAKEEMVSLKNMAAIIPFAQQDMVHAFLQGIDGEVAEYMSASTAQLFEGMLTAILGAVNNVNPGLAASIDQAVRPEVGQLLNSLFQSWRERTIFHWSPVVEIVSSLPKDELAAMAEAFVNLTKFRRRITPERETVGGPIDVAIITKGDGFVWVKRKHYFDPQLNPRTMARYTREA